jgi:hypothetical protein
LGFRCDAEGVFSDFSVITRQTHKTPLQMEEWRFAVLRWSLASQIMWWTAVFSTVPTAGCPCRSFPFQRAALFADALAGRLLFFGLAGRFSSSRYITGTLVVAIRVPFVRVLCFNNLWNQQFPDCLHSGRLDKA